MLAMMGNKKKKEKREKKERKENYIKNVFLKKMRIKKKNIN